jgi:hypothetical protein
MTWEFFFGYPFKFFQADGEMASRITRRISTKAKGFSMKPTAPFFLFSVGHMGKPLFQLFILDLPSLSTPSGSRPFQISNMKFEKRWLFKILEQFHLLPALEIRAFFQLSAFPAYLRIDLPEMIFL